MRVARVGIALAALTAGAGLALGTTTAAQAAPGTQPTAVAAPSAYAISTPVTGTFTGALGGPGRFAGSFTPTRFVNSSGQLAAVGTLTGTLTDSAGTLIGTVNRQITAPVQINATCDILNLDLGPLDLNLLGLQVHLNEIVLNITAQQGPGNLLGNLLCAIAGLLDNPGNGALNGVVALLNHIISLLG